MSFALEVFSCGAACGESIVSFFTCYVLTVSPWYWFSSMVRSLSFTCKEIKIGGIVSYDLDMCVVQGIFITFHMWYHQGDHEFWSESGTFGDFVCFGKPRKSGLSSCKHRTLFLKTCSLLFCACLHICNTPYRTIYVFGVESTLTVLVNLIHFPTMELEIRSYPIRSYVSGLVLCGTI